jgi:antitoxin component YwqK of YwqJK toxin-antitoxin module
MDYCKRAVERLEEFGMIFLIRKEHSQNIKNERIEADLITDWFNFLKSCLGHSVRSSPSDTIKLSPLPIFILILTLLSSASWSTTSELGGGNYKNGERHGLWEFYDDFNQLRHQGNYQEGLKQGIWKEYFDDHAWSEVFFKDGRERVPRVYYNKEGKLNGRRERYNEDGLLWHESNYKNGLLQGICQEYHSNGQVRFTEFYVDGKKHGYHKEYNFDGLLSESGNYKHGRKDGLWKSFWDPDPLKFFTDGRFVKIFFENGKAQGPWLYYSEVGKVDGVWKTFHSNGELHYIETFKNGKKEGLWEEYYKNGQLKTKIYFHNGYKQGMKKEYHSNGQLYSKGHVKHGFRHHSWEEYDANGQLYSKVNYKDGYRHGPSEEYVGGKLRSTRYYWNGVEIQ